MNAMLTGRCLRPLLAVAMLLPALSAAAEDATQCRVAGSRVHWTADYCMALHSTDDEILAGDCIFAELQRRFVSECEAPLYYKQAMCQLAIQRAQRQGRLEDCVDDAEFVGPTVRRGGVGG